MTAFALPLSYAPQCPLQIMKIRPTFTTAFSVSTATLFLGTSLAVWPSANALADAAKSNPAAKPFMTVTTTRSLQANLGLRIFANGNVAAWQEASVGSLANGLVLSEVRAGVGDTVQRGQILAVFASDSVAAEVAQAQAVVAEAVAQSADAAANAARARSFQASGMMSAQQISLLLTGEQMAAARVESARAMLAVQQLRFKHTQVLAPDNGVISARSATVGAVVGTGGELFRLIRQGRLEWRAEITSAELNRIKPGTAVTVTAASGTQIKGKVRMLAPTVDPVTRNALVYVDLATYTATSATVKPGMFAHGEFELGSSPALTVPQQSVVVRDGFNYVFKVNNDNRVAQQKVEVGRRVGEQVEITTGLDANTTIAVLGAGFLNDGDTVRVNNSAAETSTSNRPLAPAQPAQAATK